MQDRAAAGPVVGVAAASRSRSDLAATMARVQRRYLARTAARTSLVCLDAEGRPLDPGRVRDALVPPDRRPTLAVYWIADALAVAMLPLVDSVFHEVVAVFRFLYDDTFWGRVCARFQETLGGRYTILALPGRPTRLVQLKEVIRERASCALAVDGGGPYGRVGTGLITLGGTVEARIVPLAACASSAVTVARRSRVRLPLPGGTLAVVVGAPIPVARRNDRHAAAESVRRELEGLRVLAEQAAGLSPAGPRGRS